MHPGLVLLEVLDLSESEVEATNDGLEAIQVLEQFQVGFDDL